MSHKTGGKKPHQKQKQRKEETLSGMNCALYVMVVCETARFGSKVLKFTCINFLGSVDHLHGFACLY